MREIDIDLTTIEFDTDGNLFSKNDTTIEKLKELFTVDGLSPGDIYGHEVNNCPNACGNTVNGKCDKTLVGADETIFSDHEFTSLSRTLNKSIFENKSNGDLSIKLTVQPVKAL